MDRNDENSVLVKVWVMPESYPLVYDPATKLVEISIDELPMTKENTINQLAGAGFNVDQYKLEVRVIPNDKFKKSYQILYGLYVKFNDSKSAVRFKLSDSRSFNDKLVY